MNHSLFLSIIGKVYALGTGIHGELGLGESVSRTYSITLIEQLSEVKIRKVYAGVRTSFLISGMFKV